MLIQILLLGDLSGFLYPPALTYWPISFQLLIQGYTCHGCLRRDWLFNLLFRYIGILSFFLIEPIFMCYRE